MRSTTLKKLILSMFFQGIKNQMNFLYPFPNKKKNILFSNFTTIKGILQDYLFLRNFNDLTQTKEKLFNEVNFNFLQIDDDKQQSCKINRITTEKSEPEANQKDKKIEKDTKKNHTQNFLFKSLSRYPSIGSKKKNIGPAYFAPQNQRTLLSRINMRSSEKTQFQCSESQDEQKNKNFYLSQLKYFKFHKGSCLAQSKVTKRSLLIQSKESDSDQIIETKYKQKENSQPHRKQVPQINMEKLQSILKMKPEDFEPKAYNFINLKCSKSFAQFSMSN